MKELWMPKNERVREALKVYKEIVTMDLATKEERIENVKNASYFIWALYAERPDTRFDKIVEREEGVMR